MVVGVRRTELCIVQLLGVEKDSKSQNFPREHNRIWLYSGFCLLKFEFVFVYSRPHSSDSHIIYLPHFSILLEGPDTGSPLFPPSID